jgi:tetratricopeptide (TPR) repeat protein
MTDNSKTSGQLLFEELAINLDEIPFQQLSNYTAVEYFLTVEDEPSTDATNLERVSRYLQSIHHLANCQSFQPIKIILNTSISISEVEKNHKITLDNYLLFKGLFKELLESSQEIINLFKKSHEHISYALILKGKALAWNGLLKESCNIYEQIIFNYRQENKIDSEVYIEAVARLGIEQIRSGIKSKIDDTRRTEIDNLTMALEQIDNIISKDFSLFWLELKIDILINTAFYKKNNGDFIKSFKLYSKAVKFAKENQLYYKISFPLGHKGIVLRDLYHSPSYLLKFYIRIFFLWTIKHKKYSLNELIAQKKEEQYKKCILYLDIAKELAEKIQIETAWINHHIAITNLNYGKIYLAEEYNQLALKEYEKIDAQKGIADCSDLQGFISFIKSYNDINNVRKEFARSLEIRKITGSQHGIFNSEFNLSIALWHEGKIIESIYQLLSSLSRYFKLSSSPIGTLFVIFKRTIKFFRWTILN